MADDNSPSTTLATAEQLREAPRALVVRPERAQVTSYVPVFDTARFEHYGRIATVMFNTGMMPESLLKDGSDWVPADVAKARAFMVTELADRWNASPFALMQACSFVHGKLMLEGKVVHGAIEANIGLNLTYDFGRYDLKREETIVGEVGEGDALGVRVWAVFEGETEPRFVDGGVGIWKTTGRGSPWMPGAFKRQLRYRGAREWARAFKPSLLVGILTDDELDGMVERQSRTRNVEKPDLKAQLKGPQAGDEGFSSGHVEQETRGRVIEAEAKVVETELKVGGEKPAADDAGNGTPAQNAGEGSATSESATSASGASQAQTDPGQAASSSKPDAGSEAKPKAETEKPKRTRAAAKPAPAPPPETEPETEAEAEPDAIGDFIDSLEGMEKWAEQIKPAWFAFKRSADYKSAPKDRQQAASIALCERVFELNEALGPDALQPHQDPTFFVAWCTYMQEEGPRPTGAQTIAQELAMLREVNAFQILTEGARQQIEDFAAHIIGQVGAGII